MIIQDEILVNKFGQNLLLLTELKNEFDKKNIEDKRGFLNDLIFLIEQSKPQNHDIDISIKISNLKETYTPCIMLRKGVANYNLQKILLLSESELPKVFLLFMSLFKIAYSRRFEIEKNHPDKWWYWDLSDDKVVQSILNSRDIMLN